jgi:hypothetical protein
LELAAALMGEVPDMAGQKMAVGAASIQSQSVIP